MESPHVPPIFLMGLPGCGKTTLGRALAQALGRQFIDLDHSIEARFFCSVSDFFSRYGEERFRSLEASILREAGEMQDVIVACGGGTPCFHGNMDYMLSRGITVHLKASRRRLHERLCRCKDRRPHIRSLSDEEVYAYIDSVAETRAPFYDRSHITFDSSMLEDRSQIDISVAHIIQILNTHPHNPHTLL